jgi:hypothetical protein
MRVSIRGRCKNEAKYFYIFCTDRLVGTVGYGRCEEHRYTDGSSNLRILREKKSEVTREEFEVWRTMVS